MSESVKSPKHYKISHKHASGEVRGVIGWAVSLLAGEKAYHHATVLKYMLRAAHKENYWQDVAKAKEHLEFLLELRNNNNHDGKQYDPFESPPPGPVSTVSGGTIYRGPVSQAGQPGQSPKGDLPRVQEGPYRG